MKKRVKKEVPKKKSYWHASMLDIAMTKWSVFFITLFIVALFPQFFANLEDWKWAFLTISILLAIKPLKSFFKK